MGAGRAVVVDLGPPGVRGDDPGGGPPLLQRVRRLHPLLDLVGRPQGAVGPYHALPCKTHRTVITEGRQVSHKTL